MDLAIKPRCSGRIVMVCSFPTALYRVDVGNSIHTMQLFLGMAHRLMGKERAEEYPGGREHRCERYTWLGGAIFLWMKRGGRAGLYREGFWLMASGWPKVLAAVVRSSIAWIRGRGPVETILIDSFCR